MSDDLIRALVGGNEDHRRKYLHSAVFKTSVDSLAAMLPLWIDGLALHADEHQAGFELLVEQARQGWS